MSRATHVDRFYYLLNQLQVDGEPLTLRRLADRALCARSHSHLSQVLHGTRRGPQTRRRVVRYLQETFPDAAAELFDALDWKAEAELWRALQAAFQLQHSTGNTP